jgi:hypothetical protein
VVGPRKGYRYSVLIPSAPVQRHPLKVMIFSPFLCRVGHQRHSSCIMIQLFIFVLCLPLLCYGIPEAHCYPPRSVNRIPNLSDCHTALKHIHDRESRSVTWTARTTWGHSRGSSRDWGCGHTWSSGKGRRHL